MCGPRLTAIERALERILPRRGRIRRQHDDILRIEWIGGEEVAHWAVEGSRLAPARAAIRRGVYRLGLLVHERHCVSPGAIRGGEGQAHDLGGQALRHRPLFARGRVIGLVPLGFRRLCAGSTGGSVTGRLRQQEDDEKRRDDNQYGTKKENTRVGWSSRCSSPDRSPSNDASRTSCFLPQTFHHTTLQNERNASKPLPLPAGYDKLEGRAHTSVVSSLPVNFS